MEKQIIIVGFGEIGNALYKVLHRAYKKIYTIDLGFNNVPEGVKSVDVMHVCFRYGKDFVKDVIHYERLYSPKCLIVHSTVPYGTINKVNDAASSQVIHAPIVGRHDRLEKAITAYKMFISGNYLDDVCGYLEKANIKTVKCNLYGETEMAKLLCLYRYALNIDMARDIKAICKRLDLDFDTVYTNFEFNYNEGMTKIDNKYMTRPIMTPPEGKIGGHCVMPSLKLLVTHDELKRTIRNILSKEES